MTKSKENTPHYIGHRQRLRTRYLESGIDSLLDHEILELLLFYSIPRVDTKPIAHRLLDAYGSLSNFFNASCESLMSNGLSESSAVLVKLYFDVAGRVRLREACNRKLTDYDEIGRLMVSELDGCPTERFVMLMLDSKDEVIGLKTICEGSFRKTKANMKFLNDCIVLRQAAKVVLAHNHPSGKLEGSTEDLVTTDAIDSFLSYVDVELIEHYIVADGTYLGLKRQNAQREKERELLYRSSFGYDRNFE